MVKELKENDMYDESHPFFVKDSPFYMDSGDGEFLEVRELRNVERDAAQEKGLNIVELSSGN